MLAPSPINAASELGRGAFPWWPDWRGQACAIIASGPSTKAANVAQLHGRLKVLAIKQNVDLCPLADVVYGCDRPWWDHRRGLPDFKGLKIAFDPGVNYPGVHKIRIRDKKLDDIIVDEPGVVGAGGNSGFQALNLAVQFGASRILLVGFDMTDRSGPHWYGRNNWPKSNNPSESNFRRWRGAFAKASITLATMGIEVVNASPISEIKTFKQMTVEQALAAWGL